LLPLESLLVCSRGKAGTVIEGFEVHGPLFKRDQIDRSLEDRWEGAPLSERLIRGDFDD
jgi:hypothetical protein